MWFDTSQISRSFLRIPEKTLPWALATKKKKKKMSRTIHSQITFKEAEFSKWVVLAPWDILETCGVFSVRHMIGMITLPLSDLILGILVSMLKIFPQNYYPISQRIFKWQHALFMWMKHVYNNQRIF